MSADNIIYYEEMCKRASKVADLEAKLAEKDNKRIVKKFKKTKTEKKVDSIKELKNRWKQLKQYIQDDIENNQAYYNQTGEMIHIHWVDAEWYILDKMKDLEG